MNKTKKLTSNAPTHTTSNRQENPIYGFWYTGKNYLLICRSSLVLFMLCVSRAQTLGVSSYLAKSGGWRSASEVPARIGGSVGALRSLPQPGHEKRSCSRQQRVILNQTNTEILSMASE
jgi:hypothetical protein